MMKAFTIQFENVDEYLLGKYACRHWSDQVVWNNDNLTADASELATALIENTINRRVG